MTLKKGELSASTKGAISELVVSTVLLKMGYHVFRALSPACPCDVIAMRDGVLLKIEITTGNEYKSGRGYSFPKKRKYDFDYIAVVYDNNVYFYNRDYVLVSLS
jgi:hypothetical protein